MFFQRFGLPGDEEADFDHGLIISIVRLVPGKKVLEAENMLWFHERRVQLACACMKHDFKRSWS
jgi:hypothetical protein